MANYSQVSVFLILSCYFTETYISPAHCTGLQNLTLFSEKQMSWEMNISIFSVIYTFATA